MIPDIKLYYELGSHSDYVKKGLKASNRLYRFTKRFLINSLDALAKK